MTTRANRSSKYYVKLFGVTSSNIKTWKTEWTALIKSRRQRVKDCRLGLEMIL